MKFLLSIPCQLIVVILVATSISTLVSKPLKPLVGTLTISNAAHSKTPLSAAQTAAEPSQGFSLRDLRPVFMALAAAVATFLLWHIYLCYRSESAIAQVAKVGGHISTPDGFTGVMRYLLSDVQINLAGKHVSARTIASLQQIHNLTSLNVANCDLNRKTLLKFEYCRFLKEIDVTNNSLSQDTLLAFRRKISATMHHA